MKDKTIAVDVSAGKYFVPEIALQHRHLIEIHLQSRVLVGMRGKQ